MPTGGDALVVLERFRRVASLATVPVIVITAHDHEPREQLARAAGGLAFLQKPLDPQELVRILAQAISWPVQLVARESAAIFRASPAA